MFQAEGIARERPIGENQSSLLPPQQKTLGAGVEKTRRGGEGNEVKDITGGQLKIFGIYFK